MFHCPYPMKTEAEAIHFLKAGELRTGKKCFVRHVEIRGFKKWEIFTLEAESYVETRKRKRQY